MWVGREPHVDYSKLILLTNEQHIETLEGLKEKKSTSVGRHEKRRGNTCQKEISTWEGTRGGGTRFIKRLKELHKRKLGINGNEQHVMMQEQVAITEYNNKSDSKEHGEEDQTL